jgi:hypothetical protein
MWLLTLCLACSQAGPPDDPRQLVRLVTGLIERTDSAALTGWRVRARHGRLPGEAEDRLAVLATATAARLSYQYPEADRLYATLIRAAPTPPDRITLYALLGSAESRLVTAPFDSAIAAFEETAELARALADTRGWRR